MWLCVGTVQVGVKIERYHSLNKKKTTAKANVVEQITKSRTFKSQLMQSSSLETHKSPTTHARKGKQPILADDLSDLPTSHASLTESSSSVNLTQEQHDLLCIATCGSDATSSSPKDMLQSTI